MNFADFLCEDGVPRRVDHPSPHPNTRVWSLTEQGGQYTLTCAFDPDAMTYLVSLQDGWPGQQHRLTDVEVAMIMERDEEDDPIDPDFP